MKYYVHNDEMYDILEKSLIKKQGWLTAQNDL